MRTFQRINWLKHWRANRLFSQLVVLGVSTGILLYSTRADAAEQVFLKYGSFRGAVSVQQLNEFVKTGKTTPALETYLKTAKQDPSVARKALTDGLKAEPALLNNLLSSWVGPILLDQVGQVVHPPARELDQQALRTALAAAIEQTGEVTLLGAIRNYPATSVELEGDRLIPVYKRLSQLSKGVVF